MVPSEYADFLVRAGGTNLYGEPNFIIIWGQTYTQRNGDGLSLLGHGIPAWMLCEWHPAEDYGSPGQWDYKLLGPYPHRGRYEILQPFYERIGGKVEHMPLNFATLEFMLPIIQKHKHDSIEKRKALMVEQKEKKEKELEDRIADRLQDACPSFTDAVSFAGQGNKHSAVQQKVEEIENAWKRMPPLQRGLQIGRV